MQNHSCLKALSAVSVAFHESASRPTFSPAIAIVGNNGYIWRPNEPVMLFKSGSQSTLKVVAAVERVSVSNTAHHNHQPQSARGCQSQHKNTVRITRVKLTPSAVYIWLHAYHKRFQRKKSLAPNFGSATTLAPSRMLGWFFTLW